MKGFVRRHPKLVVVSGLIVAIAFFAAGSYVQLQRTVPELELVESTQTALAEPVSGEIVWPELGQAGIAVRGVGLIGETANQQPQPIASLVKVMTAHLILKNHPLDPGAPGAEVEFTPEDVQNYHARAANAESVVLVSAGAKMTERELLRGLLLASGNNLADVLARWHAGSIDAFVQQMNAEAQALGMTNTIYSDAAGLLPSSVSTAHDQILLANAAMSNPTFAEIVREAQASLPGAGVVYNTNALIGSNGIVGIKTGWTEEAGACFVFAAEVPVGDTTAVLVGAVMGQITLADAFDRTNELIGAGGSQVSQVHLGKANEVAGQITSRWGETADAVLAEDVTVFLVPGMAVERALSLVDTETVEEGTNVGHVTFSAGEQVIEVPLRAAAPVAGPDLVWRLTRLQ